MNFFEILEKMYLVYYVNALRRISYLLVLSLRRKEHQYKGEEQALNKCIE